MSDPARPVVPDNYEPSRYHVDVWRSASELDAAPLDHYRAVLDENELARAARFRFDARRNEFIVARGLLRCVLGAAMRIEPAAVRFDYSPKGKPMLRGDATRGEESHGEEPRGAQSRGEALRDDAKRAADAGPPGNVPGLRGREPGIAGKRETDLRFNVSHSHGRVLVAVTVGREVGVDLEKMREKTDCEKLAARFFSAREAEALRQVPDADRRAAFFTCWTRKEALLKATGKGIGFGLDQFDVAFWPPSHAAVLSTRFDPAEAARWTLLNLDVGVGYAGSVAVEGKDVELRERAGF